MQIIGHRGAAGLAEENTVAAVNAGIGAGVDAVEFDVRVSLDSIVVVHHEPFLHDGSKRLDIATTTYKNLKKAKPNLATADELMQTINHRVAAHIEIKPNSNLEPVLARLRAYQNAGYRGDMMVVTSFDYDLLQTVHRAMPDLQLCVIERWSGVRASLRARQLQASSIAMNSRAVWFLYIKLNANRPIKLYAYTVDDPKRAARYARYGLSGIVTNHPERMVKGALEHNLKQRRN